MVAAGGAGGNGGKFGHLQMVVMGANGLDLVELKGSPRHAGGGAVLVVLEQQFEEILVLYY